MKIETFSWLKQKFAPYRRHIIPLLGFYVYLNLKWYQLKALTACCLFKRDKAYASYSVVSACFNVADYLDFFLESLIHQSLDFKNNIKVILVDDGSKDNTWEKIQLWQQRYPLNIIALRQKNAGQASARNYGLSYVKSSWVTFADPDDFYDPFSFEKVDNVIGTGVSTNIAFVSLNFIPFYEDKKGFIEDHPLRYRFKDPKTIRKIETLDNYIQMSVNSLFIRSDIAVKNLFSSLIKPSFEDSFYINILFLDNMEKDIVFLKEAYYFYRKRKNKTSALDLCWNKREQFIDVLKYGLLELLKESVEKFNKVPTFIQNVAIYHIQWYFLRLRNREDRVSFLTQQEINEFIYLLKECFSYIEPKNFQRSCSYLTQEQRAEISFFLRNNSFEQKDEAIPVAQIPSMLSTRELKIQLLCQDLEKVRSNIVVCINDIPIKPISVSYARNTFCGKTLSYWFVCWLRFDNFHSQGKLSLKVNGVQCPLAIKKIVFTGGVTIKEIASILFLTQNKKLRKDNKYDECWLISDRDCLADDNGEHFYRYLKDNKPEINAWFLLKKNSHHWKRLQNEGFKLISYGSKEHKKALKYCCRLISSHADEVVTNPFGDQITERVPFIFLQHGVIKDDLSFWLNQKKIRLMITTTREERDSIINHKSKYQFGEKEIILTGLPRHDSLMENNNPQKLIIVMPTWRNSIVGNLLNGTERTFTPDFMKSGFVKSWSHFLVHPLLLDLLLTYDFHLKFFPHLNCQQYSKYLGLPPYVEICSHATHRFQEIVGQASLMITDYSSAAFDMAYLEKAVIYYQFDKGEIFKNDNHTYQKGYFDYAHDGFGPVVEKEEDLFRCIESSLKRNCTPEQLYLKRMQTTFPFRDGRCCERVFNEVTALGKYRKLNN